MAEKGEQQFLQSKLGPLVDASSLETVVAYLSSLQGNNCRDEMVLFLEGVFGYNEQFSGIIENAIRIRMKDAESGPSRTQSHQQTPSSGGGKTLNPAAAYFQPVAKTSSALSAPQQKHNQPQKTMQKNHQRHSAPGAGGGCVGSRGRGGVCGCLATYHPFLVSCLCCGRVHCTQERALEQGGEQVSSCCVFCGALLVLEATATAAAASGLLQEHDEAALHSAYQQKVQCCIPAPCSVHAMYCVLFHTCVLFHLCACV